MVKKNKASACIKSHIRPIISTIYKRILPLKSLQLKIISTMSIGTLAKIQSSLISIICQRVSFTSVKQLAKCSLKKMTMTMTRKYRQTQNKALKR